MSKPWWAILFKGVAGGAMAGLLLAFCILQFFLNQFVRRDNFHSDAAYELGQRELGYQIFVFSMLICTAIGPLIASISFGPWLRDSWYGFVGMFTLIAVSALICAAARDEQPFNHYKGASPASIETAVQLGLPLSLILGPIIGVSIGRWWRKPVSRSGDSD